VLILMGDYLDTVVKSCVRDGDSTQLVLSDEVWADIQFSIPLGLGLKKGDVISFYLGSGCSYFSLKKLRIRSIMRMLLVVGWGKPFDESSIVV
jgi:hypothetical protein